MRNDVAWMLELEIQPGRENDFRAFMAEMVSATQANEPGTLSYEWSTSAGGRVCHIYERYVDSAAVMIHAGTFDEKFAGRFSEIFKPIRVVVSGSPSAAVKDALAGFSPIYAQAVGGFTR